MNLEALDSVVAELADPACGLTASMSSSDMFSLNSNSADVGRIFKEFFESPPKIELFGELLCLFGARVKICRVYVNSLTPENKQRLLVLVRNRCFDEISLPKEGDGSSSIVCRKFQGRYKNVFASLFNKKKIFRDWFRSQSKPVRKFIYFSVSDNALLENLCAPLLL